VASAHGAKWKPKANFSGKFRSSQRRLLNGKTDRVTKGGKEGGTKGASGDPPKETKLIEEGGGSFKVPGHLLNQEESASFYKTEPRLDGGAEIEVPLLGGQRERTINPYGKTHYKRKTARDCQTTIQELREKVNGGAADKRGALKTSHHAEGKER